MYSLEQIDIERYNITEILARWDYPWFYWPIKSQQTVEEWKIQRYWADKIDLVDKSVNILNSGFGFFSVPFAFEKGAKSVHLFDMCPITEQISWTLNEPFVEQGYDFIHHIKNITFDRLDIRQNDPDGNVVDVIINTSCEHSFPMHKLLKMKYEGCMCVMSGNNLTKRGHINLIHSLDQLEEQCGLSKIIDRDVQTYQYTDDDLGPREYNQFTIIGIK